MSKVRYYKFAEDQRRYPQAWLYAIIGGRKRGKTYSTLLDCIEQQNKRDFIFIKRTMDDVDMICSGSGNVRSGALDIGVDLDPFAAINRDEGTDYKCFSIRSGIAGCWHTTTTEDGKLQPVGAPAGMIFALNGVTKYKGMELASSKMQHWMIFDEFIPNIYDRVNRKEGIQLLDFYMTVSRDRVQRGLEEVKLICLANATDIANPVFDTLELTDTVADMQANGVEEWYDPDRCIYIHNLDDDPSFMETEKKTGLYKAMANTAWGRVTYGNQFAYNDFSNISNKALKGYRCIAGWIYRESSAYIYYNDGQYYVTTSPGKPDRIYNLNLENDQKLFFLNVVIDLRMASIEGRVKYKKYSFYDLITNYKKVFKI